MCIRCFRTRHAINSSLEVEQGLFTYLVPLRSKFIRSVPTASTMAKMPEKIRARWFALPRDRNRFSSPWLALVLATLRMMHAPHIRHGIL